MEDRESVAATLVTSGYGRSCSVFKGVGIFSKVRSMWRKCAGSFGYRIAMICYLFRKVLGGDLGAS